MNSMKKFLSVDGVVVVGDFDSFKAIKGNSKMTLSATNFKRIVFNK